MYVGKHPDSKFFNTSYPWLETWHKLSLAPAAPRLGKTPVFSPQEKWKKWKISTLQFEYAPKESRAAEIQMHLITLCMLILNFLDTHRIIIFINILPETVVSFLSLQLDRASSPYIPKRLRQVSYLDMIGRKQQPWSTHCKKKIIINI